jgi:hypothetical protein
LLEAHGPKSPLDGTLPRARNKAFSVQSGGLSRTSGFSSKELRRLAIALESDEDDVPANAMEALVDDFSVPATEVLFQYELIYDGTNGWGAAGAVVVQATHAPRRRNNSSGSRCSNA